MILIIGLGNPGEKYKNTRHNVGFMVVDRLQTTDYSNAEWSEQKKFNAEVCKIGDVILAKPTSFMNNSGVAVRKLSSFYNLQTTDIWVVHDDLDIPLSQYKIQLGIGPKVHNGITSINEALKTKKYWRVRVGIENRTKELSINNSQLSKRGDLGVRKSIGLRPVGSMTRRGEEYVLQNFTKDELEILSDTIGKILGDIIKQTGIHG